MTHPYSVISPTNSTYPGRLRAALPDTDLYVVGNLDLLDKRAVGICGARDASAKALTYAERFGDEAARQGLVLVSGYARGVDRQAHKGAMSGGGATIAVLPQGIDSFRLIKEFEMLADYSRNFLALSMFPPEARWQVWRAMERNRLIVGLSEGMFVVEAREKGGTIKAAEECIRQNKPLWAYAYSDDSDASSGNRKLLKDSARPIIRPSDLREVLTRIASGASFETGQLAMRIT